MSSIVGRILGNYLSDYVKDFSADKFVDWSLTDLSLRESVVQSLVGIPLYLEVRQATCTKIAAQVPPLASLYAGSEPIVLKFERIEIQLEEPVVLVLPEAPAVPVPPPAPPPSGDSYVDRFLQNIKFEIGQVVITVKTLGSPVRLRVRVQDIVVHSTDDSYQTELTNNSVRVNRDNTESIQYRHVTLGRASLILVAPDGRESALLDDTPLDVRIKTKRAVGTNMPLAFQIVVELEQLAVQVGAHDYKQFERMLDSLLDCIYRGEAALVSALTKQQQEQSKSKTTAVVPTDAPQPPAPPASSSPPPDTYWGRLTSYFSRSYYAEPVVAPTSSALDALEELDDATAPPPAAPAPSAEDLNRAAENAMLRSKFDELAAQQLETTSLVYFDDSEDFDSTMYSFKVTRGTMEALENVLQQPRRLALLEFDRLRCHFVPSTQSEARVTIGALSLTSGEAPDVYRGFERVIVAGDQQDDSDSLVLTYVRGDPAALAATDGFHRKVHVQTRDWTVIYDHRFWARVYQFFFGSELGTKFETYVDASVEMALGVVVSERVDVRVVALRNTLVLPPFAGYGGPAPLAGFVLRLATERASFASSDAEADWRAVSRVPDDLCVAGSLFADTSATFPHRAGDYSTAEAFIVQHGLSSDAARFGTPTRSQRFAMRLSRTCCTMHSAPEAPAQTVLEPVTVDVDIVLQEYSRRSPLLELARAARQRVNPRLEIYVRVRDMTMALTHAQYVYMLHVLEQRLAWSAAQLTEQQRAERIMEEIVRAADSGRTAVSAVEIERRVDEQQQRRLEAVRDALKFVALVDMGQLRLTLFDDVVIGGSADQVLAHVALARVQLALESDLRRSSIKMLIGTVDYRTPQYADTPFGALFEPLSAAGAPALVALRYDTDSDARSAHATVALNALRIMLLLDAIAKLQLFFDDKLARPASDSSDAVAALRATVRDAYAGSTEAPASLDYDVQLSGCEVALVESPSVNEFVPMFIDRGTVTRRATSPLAASIVVDTHGVTLFAYMRETPQAPRRRDQLCTPVRLRAYWNQSCPRTGAPWVSDIVVLFDDFSVSLTRAQLVMLQNILDYQLEGLAEAGKLQTTAIDLSGTAAAIDGGGEERRRGSFVVQILNWRLSLKRDELVELAGDSAAVEFAAITARDFVYATEDSPHEWRMLITAADLTICDRQPAIPLFETVVCSKPASTATSSKAAPKPAAARTTTRLAATHSRSRLRDALRSIDSRPARPPPPSSKRRRHTSSAAAAGDGDAWQLIQSAAVDQKSFYAMISKRRDEQLLRVDHVSRLEFGRGVAVASTASSAASVAKYRAELERRRSELAQQVALRGGESELLYQLSCVHARLGETQMCLEALERAVLAGFDDWMRVEADVTFDSVRNLARFAEVAALRRQRSSTSTKRRFRATLRESAASKERAESGNRWLTRWVFELNPMLVVYTPTFAARMQAFFQLLDEQKNLRKQYNRISAQLASLSVDTSMLAGGAAPASTIVVDKSKDDDDDSNHDGDDDDDDDDDDDRKDDKKRALGTTTPAVAVVDSASTDSASVIKMVLRQPTLLFPEQLSDKGVSVGQIDLDTLFASNDNESASRTSMSRRTDIFVSQAQLLLEVITTDVKLDDDSAVWLFDEDERAAAAAAAAGDDNDPFGAQARRSSALDVALVHSVSVVEPMNLTAQVLAKDRALSDDAPYTSIAVDVDMLVARLSLHKSSQAVAAVQKYLANVIAHHASSDAAADAAPAAEAVDRRMRLSAGDVRLTVVSDYASNLDLFYVYGKNVEAFAMNYAAERFTEFALAVRLEVHVNDLNFMIPEVLIGATQLTIDGTSGVWLDESVVMSGDELPPADAAATAAAPSSLSVRLVSLERISLRLTNEVLRHVLEIYNLQDSHNDMSSHFQYILVNHTEAPLGYGQTNTSDVQTLAADSQVPFSFTNPYRRKLLDFYVEGWMTSSGIGIDDAGHTLVRICADTDFEVRRELIVRVRPRELKRYVEFYAAHELVNDTDCALEFELDYSAEVLSTKSVRRLYACAAGGRAPFACDASWRASVRVRPDADWSWGTPMAVDEGASVSVNDSGDVVDVNGGAAPTPVQSSSALLQQHRTFLVSRERDRRGRLTLRVSAPLTLENVTPFAVEFAHGDRARGGAVAPGAARCVYDAALLAAPLSLRVLPYDVWSTPVPNKRGLLLGGALQVRRHVAPPGERHDLTLALAVAGKAGRPRTLYVAVPYVLANRADVRIELLQQGREDGVSLGVHDTKPFSWHPTGSHRFAVRVVCRLTGARTEWSEPQRLRVARDTSITVGLPGGSPIRYNVRFSVKQTDSLTRVVVFTPRFVFHNALPRPLLLEQNVEIALNSLRITVPPNGSAGSSLVTRTAFVTVVAADADERWSSEPFVLAARSPADADENSLMNRVADVAGLALAGVSSVAGGDGGDDGGAGDGGAAAGGGADGNVEVDGVRENVTALLFESNKSQSLRLAIGVNEHAARSSVVRVQALRTATIAIANDTNRAIYVRIAEVCLPAVGTTDHSTYRRANEGARSHWRHCVRVAAHGETDLLVPAIATLPPRAEIAYETVGGAGPPHEWSAPFPIDVRRAARRSAEQSIVFRNSRERSTGGGGGGGGKRARSPSPRRAGNSDAAVDDDDAAGAPPLAAVWERQGRSFVLRIREPTVQEETGGGRFRIARASLPWVANAFLSSEGSVARSSSSLLPPTSLSSESLSGLASASVAQAAAAAAAEVVQRVELRLPLVEVSFATDADSSETLWFRFRNTEMTLVRRRGGDAHLHFTLGRLEADATSETVEYPVLIAPQLDSLAEHSNMIEVLIEWHKGVRVRTVDYVGVRVLPLVIKIDAEVLAFYTGMSQLLWPSASDDDQDAFVARRTHGAVARGRHEQLAALLLDAPPRAVAADDDDAAGEGDADTLLDKLVMFPLRLTLCVGNNSAGWPVIADEATIQMALFTRANVFGDRWRIASQLGRAYAQIGWTEVYKIIASLDAIGSPLATVRKLGRGAKDFVVLPLESLVLDDTPGAFVVGVWRGTRSLFANAADALLTTLMKIFMTLAWLFTLASIDHHYRRHKAHMRRRHPATLGAALVDGALELLWSWGQALGGPVLVPLHWFDTLSWFAVPLGAVVAVLTLPFKLVGGVLDLVARTFEGVLTLLHVASDTRFLETREPPVVRLEAAALAERFVRKQLAFNETLHCAALCRVVTRTQRLRTRFVALTDSNLWIVNTTRLADASDRLYQPKCVPTFLVDTVELPQSPETTFHVCTVSRAVGGRARFSFIVPNRSAFADGFAKLDVTVEQTGSETVDGLLHHIDTFALPLPVNSVNASRFGGDRDDFSMGSSFNDAVLVGGAPAGADMDDDIDLVDNDDGKRRARTQTMMRAATMSAGSLGATRVFFPERRPTIYASQTISPAAPTHSSQKTLLLSPPIATGSGTRRPTGVAVATPATELMTLSNESQ